MQSESEDNPTTIVGLSSLFSGRNFSHVIMGQLTSISLFRERGKSYKSCRMLSKILGKLKDFHGSLERERSE